jgi:hypothetical protein
LPNSLSDMILRAQIHTDMQAAWTGADKPKKIHDGRPRTVKGKSDLPYAVITLKGLKQEKQGLRRIAATYEFELTYVGSLYAIAGQVLETVKQTRANALISILTAGPSYAGAADRMVTAVDFSEGETTDNEPSYEVTITFQATVIDAY